MINLIGRFFRRIVVYQVIFFWAILKLKSLEKYSNELKDNIKTNMISINLQSDFLDFLLENSEPLTKYISYLEILFATLAVFGVRFGAYMTVCLLISTALVYFNPLIPENRISLYDIKIDLLFIIGTIIVIIIDCCFETKKKPKNEEELEEIEIEEENKERIRKKKKLD
jgi:hypothetical protein